MRDQIRGHFGDHQPTALDIGCGADALLELGVVSPDRYTGVDPSQAGLLIQSEPRGLSPL